MMEFGIDVAMQEKRAGVKRLTTKARELESGSQKLGSNYLTIYVLGLKTPSSRSISGHMINYIVAILQLLSLLSTSYDKRIDKNI